MAPETMIKMGFPPRIGNSYFRGLCLLGLEDRNGASGKFLEYVFEYPYHPGANWYLALTLIHEGELYKAVFYLDRLKKMKNPYQKQATRLRRKI